VVSPVDPIAGVAATPDGGGNWLVSKGGAVYALGDAKYFGSLPGIGVVPNEPIVALVPTADQKGLWLIGGDGGVFAFGDAPSVGSLPGLGVHVADVAGGVPAHY
jgi:hypothetical protein